MFCLWKVKEQSQAWSRKEQLEKATKKFSLVGGGREKTGIKLLPAVCWLWSAQYKGDNGEWNDVQWVSRGACLQGKRLTCLIDGNENEFDKKAQESNSKKSNRREASYFPELSAIWLFAAFQ